VRQEGITLDASFTATVNADLSIGQTAEELTVTAEAPLIDVQNSLSQRAIDRATSI
jgi:hypothetical protein